MELFSNRSKRTFLHENFVIRDIIWYYTFLAVFFKSVIFMGFALEKLHVAIDFSAAWKVMGKNFALYTGFTLLMLSVAFLFKNRGRLWFLLGLNLFVSILFCADLWYFRGFNTMPTLLVLKQGTNLNNMSESLFGMMRTIDLVFLADFLLLIPAAVLLRKQYRQTRGRFWTFGLTFVLSIALLSCIPIKLAIEGKNVRTSIIYPYDAAVTSQNLSPMGFHMYSVYTFFRGGKTLELDEKGKQEIRQWYADNREDLPDNPYKGMFAGKNLLVIQVESLEKFVINRKINGQEITPNLNRMLANSLYFTGVHEQVHEGNTMDAEFMTNTSIFPLKQGSTSFLYPYHTYPNSLPKIMSRMGYRTTAIHPDEGSFWNWEPFLTAVGFENCVDLSSFEEDEKILLGLSDASFLRQVEPMLVKQKQPFYTFMITLTNHTPFELPYRLLELELPQQIKPTRLGAYFQSVHYTDKQLGILMDRLQKDGILDNTVVVFYGDHEGLHKYFPDSLQRIKPSEQWWMDNQKQTPLLVYQNQLKGEEIKTTGGQIDILPTLSYLMGVDEKEYVDTAMGRNLLKTQKSYAVLQGGVYVGDMGNEKQKEHAVKALDIGDRIVRSHYFMQPK